MSGQLFKVNFSNQQTVYANGQAFLGSAVKKDGQGFVTEILTPLSDTISKVEIRVANVENLGRVQPLSAKFDIEIRDSYGGLIAQGTSQFEDLDILQPVTFS